MNAFTSQKQVPASDIDFKQFARNFEAHRNSHPQESFQRSLTQFLGATATEDKRSELNRS